MVFKKSFVTGVILSRIALHSCATLSKENRQNITIQPVPTTLGAKQPYIHQRHPRTAADSSVIDVSPPHLKRFGLSATYFNKDAVDAKNIFPGRQKKALEKRLRSLKKITTLYLGGAL